MKSKKGFTLVEVLVTIVIIALLGGIGVIAVQGFLGTEVAKIIYDKHITLEEYYATYILK